MASRIIISWRDIPAQVLVREGRRTEKRELSERFIQAIDRAAWARARFDGLGPTAYTWSGQVMEPADGLGYAGRNPLDSENVYIITGDSGHGLTHGTLGP